MLWGMGGAKGQYLIAFHTLSMPVKFVNQFVINQGFSQTTVQIFLRNCPLPRLFP